VKLLSGRHKNKKVKKSKEIFKDLWDPIMCINICIVEVSETRREPNGRMFEEMIGKNFPKLLHIYKFTTIQVG
jgi:hypothetical protein